MIKFDRINGTLFRMVEPKPLQLDSELPCVVRLIRDGTQMGKYNKDMNCWDTIKDMLWITRSIKGNPLFNKTLHAYEKDSNGKESCIASIHQLEIIGYPVEEGSAEWGEYQAQQGIVVRHKHGCVVRPEYDSSSRASIFEHYPTGWQIYKEPEPAKEPIVDCNSCKHRCPKRYIDHCKMYEPKPTFKVGDWVRGKSGYDYKITAYPSKFLPDNPNVYDAIPASCMDGQSLCLELSDIEPKIKPSEVVIHIGCLRGTVTHAISDDCFLLAKVNDPHHRACCIDMSMLDKETRELVEGLLKAQEEE